MLKISYIALQKVNTNTIQCLVHWFDSWFIDLLVALLFLKDNYNHLNALRHYLMSLSNNSLKYALLPPCYGWKNEEGFFKKFSDLVQTHKFSKQCNQDTKLNVQCCTPKLLPPVAALCLKVNRSSLSGHWKEDGMLSQCKEVQSQC